MSCLSMELNCHQTLVQGMRIFIGVVDDLKRADEKTVPGAEIFQIALCDLASSDPAGIHPAGNGPIGNRVQIYRIFTQDGSGNNYRLRQISPG